MMRNIRSCLCNETKRIWRYRRKRGSWSQWEENIFYSYKLIGTKKYNIMTMLSWCILLWQHFITFNKLQLSFPHILWHYLTSFIPNCLCRGHTNYFWHIWLFTEALMIYQLFSFNFISFLFLQCYASLHKNTMFSPFVNVYNAKKICFPSNILCINYIFSITFNLEHNSFFLVSNIT